MPTRQLVWHDAGYSDLIKVWDHKIVLEPFHGMTRYTDQVEIIAGPLTVAAWLFAKVFYAHRQRRLSRLGGRPRRVIIEPAPACVEYFPRWLSDPEAVFERLQAEIGWNSTRSPSSAGTLPTPRLTAWVGDGAYRVFRDVNQPQPWPVASWPRSRDRLVRELGVEFNSCLANLYRNGSDSMGFHSDNGNRQARRRPTIASVSLGASRRFLFRHRRTRARLDLDLGRGDLLVMRDESQSDYAHAVLKTSRPIGPRINLTFRQFQAGF